MQKSTKYLVACFVIVILVVLVIYSSSSNSKNYYIKATDGAVEIWQGRFAPMSQELLVTLPGAQPPQSIKEVYIKEEVFPLIFNYYVIHNRSNCYDFLSNGRSISYSNIYTNKCNSNR